MSHHRIGKGLSILGIAIDMPYEEGFGYAGGTMIAGMDDHFGPCEVLLSRGIFGYDYALETRYTSLPQRSDSHAIHCGFTET
jgi:hypothetical protein